MSALEMITCLMPTDKTTGLDPIRVQRGRAFTAWLKPGLVDPLTRADITPEEFGRIIGKRPAYTKVLMNDCFDSYEERIKLPSESLIDKIAARLNLDCNEGRRAAGRQLLERENVEQEGARSEWIPLPNGGAYKPPAVLKKNDRLDRVIRLWVDEDDSEDEE